MEFSQQKYWSRLPFHSPGDLLNPGIESASLSSPHWQAGFSHCAIWEAHSGHACLFLCSWDMPSSFPPQDHCICSCSQNYELYKGSEAVFHLYISTQSLQKGLSYHLIYRGQPSGMICFSPLLFSVLPCVTVILFIDLFCMHACSVLQSCLTL